MKLVDIARVIRSKNAGPTTLTLDLMFNDEAGYAQALGSSALTPAALAGLKSGMSLPMRLRLSRLNTRCSSG